MRLFKPDAYAVITAGDQRIDLSQVSPATGRRLDIAFNCFLSETSEPNTGECTIYNLQQSTRNAIIKDAKIEIFAGYNGIYRLISIGDIVTVSNRNPSTDWETKITWGDGQRAYLDTNFSKSYKEGVKVQTILDDLVNSFGIAVNTVGIEGQINGGLSVDGKTKDLLNSFTKDYGIEWTIQDEVVQVVNGGEPVDNEAILINIDTGLLEFPQISEKGIDFTAQLNTDLRPNKLVEIQSAGSSTIASEKKENIPTSANGVNIIQTVRFFGDNFGGQFAAMCNCVAYDG